VFAAMGLAAALVMTPAGASSTQEAAQAVKQQDVADRDIEAARIAYDRGDFPEVIRLFRLAADRCDATARADLGPMYVFCLGGPVDGVDYSGWIRLAADQGDARAQFMLAYAYLYGQGVPEDAVEAARWMRLAADQGDMQDQYWAGLVTLDSGSGPQIYAEALRYFRLAAEQGYARAQWRVGRNSEDDVEAVRWFRLAADQGDFDGQYELALIYQAGRGVPQDYVEAYKWFSLAAARDNYGAVRRRDEMTALMTPAQIAEGQRLAAEWRPRSPE